MAREMTKIHEEFISGTVREVIDLLKKRGAIRGEITVVFAAATVEANQISQKEVAEEFERLRASGMRRNDAVKAIAEKFGLRKNEVYRMLLPG